MQSYDLSHLPQPVHDALLHLMEAFVQAWSPASKNSDCRRACAQRSGTPHPPPEDATAPTPIAAPGPQHQRRQRAPRMPTVPRRPVREVSPVPLLARCPHGTPALPCCAACATVYRAETVLAEVQAEGPQRFPRRDVELQVLEALQALDPLPATARQIAAMVGLPQLQVRTILQALGMLGTVEHPRPGYYRHRATE
jgi:hypothetical protein